MAVTERKQQRESWKHCVAECSLKSKRLRGAQLCFPRRLDPFNLPGSCSSCLHSAKKVYHNQNNVSKAFEEEGNGLEKFHLVIRDGRGRPARGGSVGQSTEMPRPQLRRHLRPAYEENSFSCTGYACVVMCMPFGRAGNIREQELHHRRAGSSLFRHVGKLQESGITILHSYASVCIHITRIPSTHISMGERKPLDSHSVTVIWCIVPNFSPLRAAFIHVTRNLCMPHSVP
jgi:hypothetical protein